MGWTPLHAVIHRTIRARKLLKRQQHILVAVSGGQDSLCLIKLLLDLQAKWEWNLGIAHCNHLWRDDSTANAEHVEQLAQNWSIPFYLETADEPIDSEATARNWRYRVLESVALMHNYSCIITGHTASDRAETLLYNLMRGTGADGLQALTWKRNLSKNIQLVRPLLEINRAETAKFCQDFQLPIWEDSTNHNFKYARNRIRQELIPYLRENFNPQVESNLAQTAELLQAEVEYLEQAAQELRQAAMRGGESDEKQNQLSTNSHQFFRLNRQVLKNAPLALQRRVMRQVLLEMLPYAPNFEHIEKLTALIAAPQKTQTDPFPGGVIAFVDGEWICWR
ncbi:tRNA(Ile)-lysidine synthetase [Calothrix sp. NIES-4101]|nr:tRNA(Ile)-lysidine synthetase [Calothrix sp. NIES-4101]